MNRRGVTLIEMLIVAFVIGIIVSISFPAVSAGLDGIRLRTATDSIVALLNGALTRTDRREEPMELIITPKDRTLVLYSADPNYIKRLQLSDGIHMAGDDPRRYMLLPGGAPPELNIDISNDRGAHKTIRIDPLTGVPQS